MDVNINAAVKCFNISKMKNSKGFKEVQSSSSRCFFKGLPGALVDSEIGVLASVEFKPIPGGTIPKTKDLFAVVTGGGNSFAVADDLAMVSSNFLVDGLKNSFFLAGCRTIA